MKPITVFIVQSFNFVSISAGVDFVHTEENVTFARGVDQAQITIPLINDVFPEATESFQVFLSASPGVYIQSPAVATVMINDRDPDLPGMFVIIIVCQQNL